MNNTCRPSFATSNTRDMGVYLHIPFCRKKCSYCDFASYEGLEAYYDDYVIALCTEIKLWAKNIQKYFNTSANYIFWWWHTYSAFYTSD